MGKITNQAGKEITNIMLSPSKYRTLIINPLSADIGFNTSFTNLFKYAIDASTSKPYLSLKYDTETSTGRIINITEFDKESGDDNQIFKVDNTGQVQVKSLSGSVTIKANLESIYSVPLFLTKITNKDNGKVLTFILPSLAETDGTTDDTHGRLLKWNGMEVGYIEAMQMIHGFTSSQDNIDYTGHTLGSSNYVKWIHNRPDGQQYSADTNSFLNYDFFKTNQNFYAEVDFCVYRSENGSNYSAFNFPGVSGAKTTIRFRVRNDEWEWMIFKNWPIHGSDSFDRLPIQLDWIPVIKLPDGVAPLPSSKFTKLTNSDGFVLDAGISEKPSTHNLQMHVITTNPQNSRLEFVVDSIKIFGINK